MIFTARGAKIYQGKPCAEGHTVRYAANGNCVVCAIAHVRVSEWHKIHHPEINRKAKRRYDAANRERIIARARELYPANKERRNERRRELYAARRAAAPQVITMEES